ncbi:hypothetical protein INR49_013545 [Caranx melampygus]|nr:hypothetical protein INR49_013545 [Caranx melampygus]
MLIIFFLLLMLRVGRCTGEQTFELKTVHVGNDVNLTCDRKGPEPDVTAAPTSDPVHLEDPLLCSNLSDSEKKLCPEDKCVCCFRAGAESHPCFNSTKDVHEDDGLSTKKFICSFFKNMTSFDGGISCAMTTCEEMPADALEPVTDAAVAVALQRNTTANANQSRQRNEDTWIYSAVMFTMMKTNRQGTASAERERIYAAVKASGLDQ